MVKKKQTIQEPVEEKIPDFAPKLDHLKKLLEKTETKQEFKMTQVL